jgi:hypothetical protein
MTKEEFYTVMHKKAVYISTEKESIETQELFFKYGIYWKDYSTRRDVVGFALSILANSRKCAILMRDRVDYLTREHYEILSVQEFKRLIGIPVNKSKNRCFWW